MQSEPSPTSTDLTDGEPATRDVIATSEATDDTDAGDGTYVPPMLLVVFGLPIFLTLIWFFLRFTASDRFGRVDRRLIDGDDEPDAPIDDVEQEEISDEDDERRG